MPMKTALSLAAIVAVASAAPIAGRRAPIVPPFSDTDLASSGTGLILGRVVDATTGQPMPAAIVHLTRDGRPLDAAGALTGADGRFVFSALPAGTFDVTAEHPGFFASSFGTRRPQGDGLPLTLTDGERRGDVVIPMWPWASLAGTVVDDAGRRVAGIEVEALRQLGDGALAPIVAGSALTDTRGEYRIKYLSPGSYVVAALCRSLNLPVGAGTTWPDLPAGTMLPPASRDDPRLIPHLAHGWLLAVRGPLREARDAAGRAHPVVYVTTYYGGTTTLWEATRITVATGQDVPSIDLAVAVRPSVRIAGTVSDASGPVARAVLRLLPTDVDPAQVDATTTEVAAAVSSASGAFVLPAVAPGNYLLEASHPRSAPSADGVDDRGLPRISEPVVDAPDPRGAWARLSLAVNDRDLSDLAVRLRDGAQVSGEVSFQHPADGQTPRPFLLALTHGQDTPVTSPGLGASAPGRFEIHGVTPGWYVLTASGLPDGWQIASATVAGRDVTGTPFEVGTSDIGPLLVSIGDQTTAIAGDILDARGKLVKGTTAVIFPVNVDAWKQVAAAARHLRTERSPDGSYAFTGLAAGEYYVAAVDDAMLADWPSPALLRKLVDLATRVQVGPSERRVVNLTSRIGP